MTKNEELSKIYQDASTHVMNINTVLASCYSKIKPDDMVTLAANIQALLNLTAKGVQVSNKQ